MRNEAGAVSARMHSMPRYRRRIRARAPCGVVETETAETASEGGASMRRASALTAGLALVALAANIWLAIDISQHGALNTNGVERYPGAATVASVLSGVIIIGLLLMLVAAVLGLLRSARRGEWGW